MNDPVRDIRTIRETTIGFSTVDVRGTLWQQLPQVTLARRSDVANQCRVRRRNSGTYGNRAPRRAT